ncbi:MAG: glycosyltransferase family 2 protein [Elusimicrobiota bacterium]|nr:glycosyltransferase family 2 protein [Elusimicrobiota bacterium]
MISIIIPVYNEEKRIEQTLHILMNYIKNRFNRYEIIIVDDGSTDKTLQLLQKFIEYSEIKVVMNKQNLGKGAAVRNGVLNAEGEYIYFTDADLSTPIEELEKFLSYIKDYDIVIGSRATKGSQILVHQPFYREFMGKTFNKLVKLFFRMNFNDTQCGAKLFKKDVAKKIFSISKINGFAFDVEVLYIAELYGYKIKEVPVLWRHSKGSKVHLVKNGLEMLVDLFRIKFNNYLK